jgi:hypothetical protein
LAAALFVGSAFFNDVPARATSLSGAATIFAAFGNGFTPAPGSGNSRDISLTGNGVSDSRTNSDVYGIGSATASASLVTGELKASSALRHVNRAQSHRNNMTAQAYFGDSFRHSTSSGPFQWSTSTSATFALNIEGLVDDVADADAGALVEIIILEPGSLQTAAPEFLSGGFGIGQSWGSRIIDRHIVGLSTATTQFYDYATSGGNVGFVPVDQIVTSFPQPILLPFTPRGDFDWIVHLYTNASVGTSQSSQATADFGNTITVSYIPPEGATTVYSASGVFPGTIAIPEPTSAAIAIVLLFGGYSLSHRT